MRFATHQIPKYGYLGEMTPYITSVVRHISQNLYANIQVEDAKVIDMEKIESLNVYKNNIDAVRRNEFELANNIRYPSTEEAIKSPEVKLIIKRNQLIAELKQVRLVILETIEFNENLETGFKIIDNEKFKIQRDLISQLLTQIRSIEAALEKINSMETDNYNTVVADIKTVHQQLKSLNHKINQLTGRADPTDPAVKAQLIMCGKEKASLDNTLNIKISTKEELDKILSTIEVD